MASDYFALNITATQSADISTWEKIETMKPSLHEAGHAVVARLTGFHVAWVSVDDDFIKADPLAIKYECNYSSAVCLTISSDRLEPIFKRRAALNKDAKETIIGYCMHVLAGPYAEQRFAPETFNPSPSTNDYGQAGQILAMATPSNMLMRKKLHVTARRRLEKMLDQNWHLIFRVADALRQCGTITGVELDEIISGAECKEAA